MFYLGCSEATLQQLATKCSEFLVHGVDVEGKKLGIDDDLVELLGKWSPIPVTYAGGATSIDDLDRVARVGNGRVDITVGSALDIFGGNLKYSDVVAWHRMQQGRPHAHSNTNSSPPEEDVPAATSIPGSFDSQQQETVSEPAEQTLASNPSMGEPQPDGTILYRF